MVPFCRWAGRRFYNNKRLEGDPAQYLLQPLGRGTLERRKNDRTGCFGNTRARPAWHKKANRKLLNTIKFGGIGWLLYNRSKESQENDPSSN